MILTGMEIAAAVGDGDIEITPFSSEQVNPNSVNYRLGHEIVEVNFSEPLDPRNIPPMTRSVLSNDGFVLQPNRHYLANTLEKIGSRRYVPSLIGRSSIGRLGLFLQISADLGNLGACHQWTLELTCARPIRVYPEMRIGQISFWDTHGEIAPYHGYLGQFDRPAFPMDWRQ